MKANYTLALLFVIILLDNIAASIILPVDMNLFFKWYIPEHGYAINKAILASAIILLLSPAYIIASPLLGWLSDHAGRKKPLLACLFISLLGYILLLIASDINSLLLALLSILLCNAGSSSMTMVQAAIADISKNIKRAYMLALVVAVMLPISLSLTQLADEVSNTNIHFTVTYFAIIYLAIFLTVINILLALFKLPKSLPAIPQQPIREDIFYTIKRLFSNDYFIQLILLLAIIQFSCGLYFESDNKHLTHLLISSKVRIFDYAEYLVTLLSIFVLYPLLLRFFSMPRILLGSIMVCLAGIFGCEMTANILYHWLFLSLIATGQCIAIATIWWLLFQFLSPRDWGLGMGVKGAVWALAWMVCVLAGNSLIGEISSPISFYTAIFTLIATIPLILSIPKNAYFSAEEQS